MLSFYETIDETYVNTLNRIAMLLATYVKCIHYGGLSNGTQALPLRAHDSSYPSGRVLVGLFISATIAALAIPAHAGNITAIWANEGGDKVTRDELRATNHTENLTGTVINRTWDGHTIKLRGARNEVISFNLVLEAAKSQADNVTVTFNSLT